MTLVRLRLPTAFATALALFTFISTASATATGILSTANCSGGGVIVTATTIDWTDPVGGTDGCIVTGIGTNVNYGSGILAPSTFGRILDLPPVLPGVPILGFMTFNSGPGAVHPTLFFDLTALGPGSVNIGACGPNVGDSCSVFAGSPFILTRTDTGTAVSLSANGDIRVGATLSGAWMGAFTTQLAGRSPELVISNILGGGSESSTQSGAFITMVPEPGTITMSLFGGLFVAFAFRRKARV